MGDKVKISVLETNGSEELEGPAERSLTADILDVNPTVLDEDDGQAVLEALLARINLVGALPRYALSSIHNATLSDAQLVGVSNLVNVPVVVPVKSTLKEVTLFQDGGTDKDGEYLFYKNNQAAPDLFFTWTLADTEKAVADDGIDYTSPTFNGGDTLLVYFNDIGSNHQDVSLHYLFQAVE